MKWMMAIFVLFIGFFYFFLDTPYVSEQQSFVEKKEANEQITAQGLGALIGATEEMIEKQFGKPARIDRSAYDYVWWIYNGHSSSYMQIGFLNGRVVTAYACGDEVNIAPFKVNASISELFQKIPIRDEITVQLDEGIYRFELSEEDLTFQPVVQLGHVYAQLYIDRFTGKLSSVRFMDGETFVKLRPYELVYRGELPVSSNANGSFQAEIEQANARQIFDITNVIRQRHGIRPLQWDEHIAKIAYEHSKDMKKNGYFAHESPKYGDLKERLTNGDVRFQMAGENIAAEYVDGIAAVEAWLNSKSHRETLLNEEFTHLGVGVFERYYTQDFIKVLSDMPH
ncbi:CAP domain-containing protein [Thermolongibacillus altinsuensis]|jgi:uncharacterized protein YkwD|uniref:CAP domain-containing protein n=1 Tax=Thermolongibacillus altinsuensis TaxID=575256 RepID=UPI00242A2D2B|nr:CAP domain-containing protein [Thermolongibacillus altinsuensis]GMB08580.1 putative membrane protein YlbC [Thermolongibacillus altinsuensis]